MRDFLAAIANLHRNKRGVGFAYAFNFWFHCISNKRLYWLQFSLYPSLSFSLSFPLFLTSMNAFVNKVFLVLLKACTQNTRCGIICSCYHRIDAVVVTYIFIFFFLCCPWNDWILICHFIFPVKLISGNKSVAERLSPQPNQSHHVSHFQHFKLLSYFSTWYILVTPGICFIVSFTLAFGQIWGNKQ